MGWFKKNTNKMIIVLIRVLNIVNQKLTKNSDYPNPNSYEDLAPIEDGDEGGGYSEALKWALNNKKIKNIAVSGPYGSGKSSVLRTFEKEHQEYKYLNISLSCFNSEFKNDDRKALIEESVLQQIFYQVKGNEVPYSRFKRIKDICTKDLIVTAIGWVAWFSTLIILYGLLKIPDKKIIGDFTYNSLDAGTIIILSFIAISGSIYVITLLIRFFGYSRFSKIKTSVGEVELDDKTGESILNKHLDEILYFFEKTNYDVVIVEDLDRYDELNIFQKLREINGIINNSKQVNRDVVFIYAIKDDFFKGNDRTKFFEYIIPIIPVINSSNSGDKLLAKFDASGLSNLISRDFIYAITLYIDDMRMLKNIYNEFVIYKDKLSDLELNMTNLFGFIVYKNIFPSDFAKLHNKDGMVANAFNFKSKLVHKLKLELFSKIEKIKEEIKNINKEHLKSSVELRTIYVMEFMKKVVGVNQFILNNSRVTISQAVDDANFKVLMTTNSIHYTNLHNQTTNSQITFKTLENDVDSRVTYNERIKIIDLKSSHEIEDLKIKLEQNKVAVREIDSYSLKEFFDRFPDEELFPDEKEDELGLLQFLLKNGYIDEMYDSFISHFYEGSLKKDDIDFVFSIKNSKTLAFSHTLTHVSEVVKRINRTEFNKTEVLNVDLLDYLFESKVNEDIEKLDVFIRQIGNFSKISIEFIDVYLENAKHEDLFINKLCNVCSGFWLYVEQNSNYPLIKKNKYLSMILKSTDVDNIINLNIDNMLADYISNLEMFFSVVNSSNASVEKINSLLIRLKVKFKFIEHPETNIDLLKFIYEHNLYEINPLMIESIINIENITLEREIENVKPCYSIILSSGKNELIKYINDNLDTFVENIYFNVKNICEEDEGAIIPLLNNPDLSEENKDILTIKARFLIHDLADILESKTLWSRLIELSKIEATWVNVIQYFECAENIDDALIVFFNKPDNYNKLSAEDFSQYMDGFEVVAMKLSERILVCPEINDESYGFLLRSFQGFFTTMSIDGISESKVIILIKHGFPILTQKNITILNENNHDLCMFLVESYVDEFIADFNGFELDYEIINKLLNSVNIETEKKYLIIQNLDSSVFDEDQSLLISIYNVLISTEEKVKLDIDFLLNLIEHMLPIDNKIKLATSQIPLLSNEDITRVIKILGGTYKDISEGKHPLIKNNETNNKFVLELMNKNYISSYNMDKKGIRVYSKKT